MCWENAGRVWTRQKGGITVHGAKDPSVEVELAGGLYIHWFEETKWPYVHVFVLLISQLISLSLEYSLVQSSPRNAASPHPSVSDVRPVWCRDPGL